MVPLNPQSNHRNLWELWASLVAQTEKNLHAMWKTRIRSLGQKDALERRMATYSSILAWRIPWTEGLTHYFSGVRNSDAEFILLIILLIKFWLIFLHLYSLVLEPSCCSLIIPSMFPSQGFAFVITCVWNALPRIYMLVPWIPLGPWSKASSPVSSPLII